MGQTGGSASARLYHPSFFSRPPAGSARFMTPVLASSLITRTQAAILLNTRPEPTIVPFADRDSKAVAIVSLRVGAFAMRRTVAWHRAPVKGYSTGDRCSLKSTSPAYARSGARLSERALQRVVALIWNSRLHCAESPLARSRTATALSIHDRPAQA